MPPTFMNRANRDKAWRAEGCPGKRCTHHNQNVHPMYVEDYPIPEVRADSGCGNTVYDTFFKSLYTWQ